MSAHLLEYLRETEQLEHPETDSAPDVVSDADESASGRDSFLVLLDRGLELCVELWVAEARLLSVLRQPRSMCGTAHSARRLLALAALKTVALLSALYCAHLYLTPTHLALLMVASSALLWTPLALCAVVHLLLVPSTRAVIAEARNTTFFACNVITKMQLSGIGRELVAPMPPAVCIERLVRVIGRMHPANLCTSVLRISLANGLHELLGYTRETSASLMRGSSSMTEVLATLHMEEHSECLVEHSSSVSVRTLQEYANLVACALDLVVDAICEVHLSVDASAVGFLTGLPTALTCLLAVSCSIHRHTTRLQTLIPLRMPAQPNTAIHAPLKSVPMAMSEVRQGLTRHRLSLETALCRVWMAEYTLAAHAHSGDHEVKAVQAAVGVLTGGGEEELTSSHLMPEVSAAALNTLVTRLHQLGGVDVVVPPEVSTTTAPEQSLSDHRSLVIEQNEVGLPRIEKRVYEEDGTAAMTTDPTSSPTTDEEDERVVEIYSTTVPSEEARARESAEQSCSTWSSDLRSSMRRLMGELESELTVRRSMFIEKTVTPDTTLSRLAEEAVLSDMAEATPELSAASVRNRLALAGVLKGAVLPSIDSTRSTHYE